MDKESGLSIFRYFVFTFKKMTIDSIPAMISFYECNVMLWKKIKLSTFLCD